MIQEKPLSNGNESLKELLLGRSGPPGTDRKDPVTKGSMTEKAKTSTKRGDFRKGGGQNMGRPTLESSNHVSRVCLRTGKGPGGGGA